MAEKNHNILKLKESWILCFILGVVMLNYPFLHIFNKTSVFFGVPTLILYFFIGWPISIGVIYLFVRTLDKPAAENYDKTTSEKEET